ncbi:MAG: hypothetical protein IJA48_04490 [Oscillospiraceae bacterium]|nr:hypothetical protein [Oscillospiraceae bacterium]
MSKKTIVIVVLILIIGIFSAVIVISRDNIEPEGIRVITSEEEAIAVAKVYLQLKYPEFPLSNERFDILVFQNEDRWRVMPYDTKMEIRNLPCVELTETGEVLYILIQTD